VNGFEGNRLVLVGLDMGPSFLKKKKKEMD